QRSAARNFQGAAQGFGWHRKRLAWRDARQLGERRRGAAGGLGVYAPRRQGRDAGQHLRPGLVGERPVERRRSLRPQTDLRRGRAAAPEIGLRPQRTTPLYGALADKAWAEMLTRIAPLASRRIYTEPAGRAPAPLAELSRVAPGEALAVPAEALRRALEVSRGGAL